MTPLSPTRRFKLLDAIILSTVAALIAYVFYQVDSVLAYKWDWSVIPRYLFRRDESTAIWYPTCWYWAFSQLFAWPHGVFYLPR